MCIGEIHDIWVIHISRSFIRICIYDLNCTYFILLYIGEILIKKSLSVIRRIKILLLIAADNGYKNLVLGAWGCGAFGNKPHDVAGYFKQILIDEGYGYFFDEVRFAIYGSENGKNISEFRRIFE